MTQEIEEVLNELEPRVVYDIEEEEEDPEWIANAENRLHEATGDHIVWDPPHVIKKQLESSNTWKPRPQNEIDEHLICLEKRKCKLMEDQNKLLGLLVETLEENLDPNSFTRMKSFAVKNIIEMYDW